MQVLYEACKLTVSCFKTALCRRFENAAVDNGAFPRSPSSFFFFASCCPLPADQTPLDVTLPSTVRNANNERYRVSIMRLK